MCVLSTLCGNVDKYSPFDIYIYIYIHNIYNTFRRGVNQSRPIQCECIEARLTFAYNSENEIMGIFCCGHLQ